METTEQRMRPDLLIRFLGRINRSAGAGECWPWTGGCTSAGYGEAWTGKTKERPGSVVYAHRVAYTHLVGPIPAGLTIDHLCRNPPCCNPAHLEVCSQRTNILRSGGRSAVNARKTHCPQGHAYSAANTYMTKRGGRACRTCNSVRASLKPGYRGPKQRTDLDDSQIIALRDEGCTFREIGEIVGAAGTTVRDRYLRHLA